MTFRIPSNIALGSLMHLPTYIIHTPSYVQHLMLSIPNTCDGNQQTAQNMESDILEEEIPITNSNVWGVISDSGLGVTVDKEKLNFFHKKFLMDGEYKLYGDKFPIS